MTFTLRQWIGLAAAAFVLNAALSFHNTWPTLGIELRPELSVEAAGLVLLLALWRRFAGPASNRTLVVLAAFVFVMTLGRYMEVTAPALYGRAVNLYWDARYVPDVVAMFTAQASALTVAGIVLAALAGVAALAFVLFRALAIVRDGLEAPPAARVLKVTAGVLVAAYLLGYHTSIPTLGWFSIPVSQTYTRQVRIVVDALTGPDAVAALPAGEPLAAVRPQAAPGGDVIVSFVESYGAVAWDDADLAARLAEPRRALAAAVEASGRSVVSAWIEAPTFGGGSWLSHISFLTGLHIDDAASYNALLTQQRTTLPKVFAAGGYRTVGLMPGLKNEWPEGSFYGFDAIIGTDGIGYPGPAFGWWQIPDQYALAKLDATVLGADPPAFVFFPTISTHAPFRPTPPYQADWSRLLSAAPFDAADLGAIGRPAPSLGELAPAYGDALAYTYAYWGGYLHETEARDYLLVLVGDHQPPATVSGVGVRWDVPVHVITRDAALLERLGRHGFVAGLEPDTLAGQMHELGLMLFD